VTKQEARDVNSTEILCGRAQAAATVATSKYVVNLGGCGDIEEECRDAIEAPAKVRCCADVFFTAPAPVPTAALVLAPSLAPIYALPDRDALLTSSSSCDDLGWYNAAWADRGATDVCGESDLGLGGCSGEMTWAEARAFCESVGSRMCTSEELQNDEARGTGCNYGRRLVWSSTSCGAGSYNQAYGASTSSEAVFCRAKAVVAVVRCCADVF